MWPTATVQVSRDVSDEPPSYSDHFAKSPVGNGFHHESDLVHRGGSLHPEPALDEI